MENESNFNSTEGLALINRMIKTAQHSVEDDSFYFLLWGWAVFVACVLNYVLLQIDSPYAYVGWIILMPLSGVVSMIYGAKQKKEAKVKSYIDSLMNYVLIAFLVTLFMVLFFQFRLERNTYPMVLMVYGMWLFVSGGALKFKPMIVGGIINWVVAIIAFYLTFENQLIALGLAVLLGYIIPGHMLRNKFNAATR